MKTQKKRVLPRQVFNFLLTLVMVAGMLQYAIPIANAAAVTSFTLGVTDKAGANQQVGSWSYDSEHKTFKDENGTEAPFVKTFSGTDTLRYSGKDKYSAPRMAVCTKGILLSDLLDYASANKGILFNEKTNVFWGVGSAGFTYPYSSLINRYYYPSYIIMDKTFTDTGKVEVPVVFAVYSYNQRNLAGSANQGWGSATTLTALNGGVEVPVASGEESLTHAFNILTQGADDERSLRVLLGQNAATPDDLNLGQMSYYNLDTVVFTPEYLNITTSVTNNDSSQATATVAMDDGYMKAAAGEAVSFTIADITPGYEVDTVGVSGEKGAVDVSKENGVYSFTMPDSAVTVNVSLKAASTYSVIVDNSISSGTVTVDPMSGAAGDTITVAVTPGEGKQLVAGSLKYTADGGGTYTAISKSEGGYSFTMPSADVTVTALFEDLATAPKYTVTPVADDTVYTIGSTEDGISLMTVKEGVASLKYFGTQIAPVVEHEGQEAVVFTHLRDGLFLSINVTKGDFDLVDEAQSGFNVQAGDMVKVYIVDDLTNDLDFNPTLLQ